jgi:biopolymer transport protein ExbB
VLGAIGPLLGLVGTVWGMIIAFTAIGETGGQAAAAQLSIGIAKALFHTFLGLTLAIPSLIAYGLFRERLDRLCVEGAMQATDAVNAIVASGPAPAATPAAPARPAQPVA